MSGKSLRLVSETVLCFVRNNWTTCKRR